MAGKKSTSAKKKLKAHEARLRHKKALQEVRQKLQKLDLDLKHLGTMIKGMPHDPFNKC